MIVLMHVSYSFYIRTRLKTPQKQNICFYCFVVLEPVDKTGALPPDLSILGISLDIQADLDSDSPAIKLGS
ncbi:hypothetical protein I79_020724 [Cricetulus griseus]|uniref:Uncharacterized protein n=1 Tax=Cricetulus griseus TaxID=10029 RepID=G3IAU2_CRIGR|nr:hypothetical protein I79_020724 [Cricetulus griseus]